MCPSYDGSVRVLTFGHGIADATAMTELLRDAGLRRVVDVRTAPGSRHNPDTNRTAMSGWLPEAGIAYRWDKRLGGWRKACPDNPDIALRNRSFAAYAEHMRSAAFAAAIDEVLAESEAGPTAVMCSESVWWRCHRKLIADFLTLARGVQVGHLMHDGAVRAHRASPEARLIEDEAVLVYDAGQTSLQKPD